MMKRSIAVLAVLLLVLAALCGCKTGDVAPAPEAKPGTPEQSGAAPADTAADDARQMVAGVPSIAPSFDFFHVAAGYESIAFGAVYDTLVHINEKGEYIGGVAETWDVSEDGKVYTFHIREGIQFSDGSDLTADDVVFSLESLRNSDFTSSPYTSVIAVNKVDDYTVEMVLDAPNNGLFPNLADSGNSVVVSKAAYEKYGDSYGSSMDQIVGSGPYTVSEWQFEQYICFTANENYWAGAPDVKNVKLLVTKDIGAAAIALQTGELSVYLDNVAGVNWATLENSENVHIVEFAGTVDYMIHFNMESGTFAGAENLGLREAVCYAMNKEDYVLIGSEGYGTVLDYGMDLGSAYYGNPDLTDYACKQNDLEKAKQLVADSNYNGQLITIKTYATDPYPAMATLLQSELTAAGFNCDVLTMERSTFIDQCLDQGDYEILLCRTASAQYDLDEMYFKHYHSAYVGVTGNWSRNVSPELDALLDLAHTTTNFQERVDTYAKIILMINDEIIPDISIYTPDGSRAMSKDLTIEPNMARFDQFRYYSWVD